MPAVFRAVLPKVRDFLAFWEQAGHPRYAVHEDGSNLNFLQRNEWVFSDDRDALMREVLGWDSRGLCFTWCPPTEVDRAEWGDDIEGFWEVAGLPSFLDDAFADLPLAHEAPSQETLRLAFFEAVLRASECYGFLELDMTDARDYMEDWALDDDKRERPDFYRAQGYFGVIDAVYDEHGVTPPQLLVFVGSRRAHVRRSQLKAAGLAVDRLIGMTCVVNGLDEAVMIGDLETSCHLVIH